jgi:hypothetical protein
LASRRKKSPSRPRFTGIHRCVQAGADTTGHQAPFPAIPIPDPDVSKERVIAGMRSSYKMPVAVFSREK